MSGERVERRLAAILAADVAGYTRLMGQDEAGTLARLRSHRRELIGPKVAEHKGRIVKTTGDGLLIEFPSVVEAVACAVAVQRGMAERNSETPEDKRIEFRVGINLGDVIVEDGDIHGDGVNVAARLEALAEPGDICVSATVRDHVGDRLDVVFDDLGDQTLKNIARSVRVFGVRAVDAAAMAASLKPTPPLAVPDKPSIAVLPFANMSNDLDQGFFADGIAEDIITALSRYPSLFVIARNSCFTYKGRAVDVKQIGQELGVRYVLEGSLRKSGNRIRVTAQLVQAETGNHVWAERYDRDLADLFAVQDEITEAVTIAIAPAIATAELQRAMRRLPESLDAWAAYQRGMWHLSKFTAGEASLAEQFFQRAIDLDPNFAGGYTGLAWLHFIGADNFQTHSLADAQISAERLAHRAIMLDGADAEARVCLGLVLWSRGDHEGALAEAERSLALTPNLASAHFMRGLALGSVGLWSEALVSLETSVRLDPRGPHSVLRLNHICIALYCSRQYEASVIAARQLIRSFPHAPLTPRWLAAALGQLGRTEEAREALEDATAIAPASFDMYVRNRVPWMRPEDHAHMLEGLRKAGWTE